MSYTVQFRSLENGRRSNHIADNLQLIIPEPNYQTFHDLRDTVYMAVGRRDPSTLRLEFREPDLERICNWLSDQSEPHGVFHGIVAWANDNPNQVLRYDGITTSYMVLTDNRGEYFLELKFLLRDPTPEPMVPTIQLPPLVEPMLAFGSWPPNDPLQKLDWRKLGF